MSSKINIKKLMGFDTIRDIVAYASLIVLFTIFCTRDFHSSFIDDIFLDKILVIKNVTILIVIFFLLLDLFKFNYVKFESLICSIGLLFVILITYMLGDYEETYGLPLLTYYSLILLYRNIEYRKVISLLFITTTILLILCVVLNLLKKTPFSIYDISNWRFRIRLIIGIHPNVLAYTYLYAILYYLYLKQFILNGYESVLYVVSGIILYYITGCRSVWFVGIFLFLCQFMFKKRCAFIQYNRVYSYVLLVMPVLLPVLLIVLVLLYNDNNNIFSSINLLLNGRLSLAKDMLGNEGIHLLPRIVEFSTDLNNYTQVDSSFIRFLLQYGLMPFVCLEILLLYFSYLINKRKDMVMFIIYSVVLLRMCFDVDLFGFRYNLMLFVFSYAKENSIRHV